MRKVLSILLLAFFGLPILTPLLALAPRSETNLPACCRRHGAHHCAMTATEREKLTGTLADAKTLVAAPMQRCPFAPSTVASSVHVSPFVASTDTTRLLPPSSHPTGIAQTESKLRVSQIRSRQKRGPPTAITL